MLALPCPHLLPINHCLSADQGRGSPGSSSSESFVVKRVPLQLQKLPLEASSFPRWPYAANCFPLLVLSGLPTTRMKLGVPVYNHVLVVTAFGSILLVSFIVFLLKLYRARSRILKLRKQGLVRWICNSAGWSLTEFSQCRPTILSSAILSLHTKSHPDYPKMRIQITYQI